MGNTDKSDLAAPTEQDFTGMSDDDSDASSSYDTSRDTGQGSHQLLFATPEQGEQWTGHKLTQSGSTLTGGGQAMTEGHKFVTDKSSRSSPRNHSAVKKRNKHENPSVLEALARPNNGVNCQRQDAAPVMGTINGAPITNMSTTLSFDDGECNVLSKGYLPSNTTTIKRDHAVAYLGTGASEEDIQKELNKMKNLNIQIVNFGNRAVRSIMLENFFKSKLTTEHNGTQLATTFDDVKNRWKNWDMEKEPELAEMYYKHIVGWFDVNKKWLQESEEEFLSDKRYQWKENEVIHRMKGHKVKMNFIQHRLSIAKTNAVKEMARVSKNKTSHGFYVNGTADPALKPPTFRKKPGEFHLAFLHNWDKSKKPNELLPLVTNKETPPQLLMPTITVVTKTAQPKANAPPQPIMVITEKADKNRNPEGGKKAPESKRKATKDKNKQRKKKVQNICHLPFEQPSSNCFLLFTEN